MDARGYNESQARRQNIKRPWEEDTSVIENTSLQRAARLPPIEAISYGRASYRGAGEDGSTEALYGTDTREIGAKRMRYSQLGYDTLPQETRDMNEARRRSSYSGRGPPLESPLFPHEQSKESWGRRAAESAAAAGPPETSNLCPGCRKLTIYGLNDAEWKDHSNDPTLAQSAEEAAATLTKLTKTLSSEQINVIRTPEQRDEPECPPIAEVGLLQTIHWIFDKIHSVNDLAEKFVRDVLAELPHLAEKKTFGDRTLTNNALIESMKRRLTTAAEDARRLREGGGSGPTSDAKPHTRRRSIAPSEENTDVVLSLRSPSQQPNPSESEKAGQIVVMNPPPTPSRQLPSPPGRSLPSPTSISYPSPNSGSYGIGPTPPPLSIHHTSIGTYLPPIGSTHTPDALQAHSAALQHEVSVQKIALSSLQGEHDKLLAAFSRSQLRASTLEKRHVVSDTEINTLTEEKLRLQSQVLDLERDIEEVTRSRDETRQNAVQDGAQYLEIVKKASQLEEIAGEERKRWNELKADMEARIESLSSRTGPPSLAIAVPYANESVLTPVSSAEGPSNIKIETRSEAPSMMITDLTIPEPDELRNEVQRLRNRCAEVEDALRAIQSDTKSMGGIVEALHLMRKSSLERANKVLGGEGGGGDDNRGD